MKNIFTTLIFIFYFCSSLFSVSFVNYVTYSNPTAGTIIIWINSDTGFGEGTMAQIRYGTPAQFSGFVAGEFDDVTTPGANWKVTISYPVTESSVDIEIAACTDFNNCNTSTGILYSGFVNTAGGLLLPVELTSFKATPRTNTVTVNWSTASETNNDYFEVEKSIDSQNWSSLGKINGRGTTIEQNQYTFVDESPSPGNNYYRLKQVDFDGAFEYSNIAMATINKRKTTFYPNPVENQLFIKSENLNDGDVLEIYSMQGVLMSSFLISDNTITTINCENFNTGIYLLEIRNESGTMKKTHRFLKN